MDFDGNVTSSKAVHVDLLLNVVKYSTKGGFTKKGLCSSFLNELALGSSVAIYHRQAPNFHLPNLIDEDDVPIICIGAGSGLAPFRGFWQQVCLESSQCDLEENNSNAKSGRMNQIQLFFGCFDEISDLLIDETRPLSKDVLTRFSAFSRDSNQPRKHVQDLILEQGKVSFKEYFFEIFIFS